MGVRRVIVGAGCACLLAIGPATAHADQKNSGWKKIASGSGFCLKANTGINHTSSDGIWGGVQSYEGNCSTPKDKDDGKLKFDLILQKQKNILSWEFCRNAGSWMNLSRTWTIAGTAAWWGSSRPCGAGTYRSKLVGYVYHDGTWRSGSITSPGHGW